MLILAGVAVGVVSTGAFTTIDASRETDVGVASGSDALLGLDVAQSVSAFERDRLLTVTNNLGSFATVTVTLSSPGEGTLYVNGKQGSSVTFNLAEGSAKTVEIEATGGGSLTFTIEAKASGRTVIATRTVDVEVPVIPIEIDIKPGSDRNPINPNSKGVIPVAILHTEDFDPTSGIDVSSLRFGAADDITVDNDVGAHPAHSGHIEDIDGDGDGDLVLHFPTEETGFDNNDERGQLVGKTAEGQSFRGADNVKIVGRRGHQGEDSEGNNDNDNDENEGEGNNDNDNDENEGEGNNDNDENS